MLNVFAFSAFAFDSTVTTPQSIGENFRNGNWSYQYSCVLNGTVCTAVIGFENNKDYINKFYSINRHYAIIKNASNKLVSTPAIVKAGRSSTKISIAHTGDSVRYYFVDYGN